jgi:hypothetical protein
MTAVVTTIVDNPWGVPPVDMAAGVGLLLPPPQPVALKTIISTTEAKLAVWANLLVGTMDGQDLLACQIDRSTARVSQGSECGPEYGRQPFESGMIVPFL